MWRRWLFEKGQYPDFAWDTIFSEKMTTIRFFGKEKNIYGKSHHAFGGGLMDDGAMVVGGF